MGETLAETRLEIEARRRAMARDADRLRDALDLRARFRENPVAFIGVGAAAVFLLVGGPMRAARLARRRLFRTDPEKAYDALPKPLQRVVDEMAGSVGPRAEDARRTLSAELLKWRHDPRKHGKVSKKLAKEIAEGPPGPGRSGWRAFEAAATIMTAALARKAVERFLSGEPPIGHPALDAVGTAGGAAKPDPDKARRDVTRSPAERSAADRADQATKGSDYSSMSSRDRAS